MSRALSPEDILFRQRFLSCCGFYSDLLDGRWGPNTDAAEAAFFARSAAIAAAEGTFDARTERNIVTLRCDAQEAARRSLSAVRADGTDARIISGTRSYAEQTALFRKGRFGNPPPKVTKAKAGQSWHNFGLAWDIGIFSGGTYVTADRLYDAAGPRGRIAGVEWGGDWTGGFRDNPHYQFGTQGSVAAARARFEAGCRS